MAEIVRAQIVEFPFLPGKVDRGSIDGIFVTLRVPTVRAYFLLHHGRMEPKPFEGGRL
jgi:hypothetical protein